MKKYVIIGLLLAVAAAFVIAPFLRPDSNGTENAEEAPAQFDFTENLITVYGQNIDVKASILSDDVARIEIVYDDTILYIKENPRGKVSINFDGTYRGVGARNLDLMVTLKNGETYVDNRIVRVVSDIDPEPMVAKVVAKFPHEQSSFTQGLEFYKGRLFESTGQYGQSFVAEVDLNSGKVSETVRMGLDATQFGEGITILNDVIYQLTWQKGRCFTYDLSDKIVPKDEFTYKGEGWGLTNDGSSLIMSNGTEQIVFRDPETFLIERTIEVYDRNGPYLALNELEYIDGMIWANVWQRSDVLVIDPLTGRVMQTIDCSALFPEGQGLNKEVLNGIAHNNGRIYMTGKNWRYLFEVRVEPLAP
jgi:glutaminyl-peptide cyclotransferase